MAANIRDYGAVPGSDCTAAFAAASSASGGAVYVPKGEYLVSNTLEFPGGFSLAGDGYGASRIINTTSNKPTLRAANFCTIQGLTLGRNVTAVTGGFGLDASAGVEDMTVIDVLAEHNFVNFGLGSTDWSVLRDVQGNNAVSHGFALIATGGPLQYQIFNALAEFNNGDGFHVEAAPSSGGGAPCGEWDTLQTYSNKGFGLFLSGTQAHPLGAVRLKNCMLDSDVGWSIWGDFGGDIKMTNMALGSTGAGGLYLGPTVTIADFYGVNLFGGPYHGALIYAQNWTWIGGGAVENQGSGVGFMSGRGSVHGGLFGWNLNFGTYFDPSTRGAAFGCSYQANGMGAFNQNPNFPVNNPIV